MLELSGKVFLVTGANSGIGRVTAEELGKRGAKVLLACRSLEKTQPVLDAMAANPGGGAGEFLPLDLSDLHSVRECARQVLERSDPLHVLINNAGFAGKRGTTRQGFELAFGVNHLGPFLLTELLLPKLLAQVESRVVNVSSKAHYNARELDFHTLQRSTKSLIGLAEYSSSKLANVLHVKELAARYGARGLHAYSLHPGVVASSIWRHVPQPFRALVMLGMISNEAGAKTTLYCATSSEVSHHNGLYYDECREKTPSKLALDPALARTLWEKSLEWTSALA